MFSLLGSVYLEKELLGHMVVLFNFWSKHQTVFQSGCTILHSHQQYMKVPISPAPYEHMLIVFFFIVKYLNRYRMCKYYLLFCGLSFHSLGSESVYAEIRSGMVLIGEIKTWGGQSADVLRKMGKVARECCGQENEADGHSVTVGLVWRNEELL